MGKMKRIAVWLLCCIFLAACGDGEKNAEQSGSAGQQEHSVHENSGNAEEYCDIAIETEDFFDALSLDWGQIAGTAEKKRTRLMFLGMQFYQGEPVQLWGVQYADLMNAYLCMGDGSTRLLFSELPEEYCGMDWFLDKEGNAYLFGYSRNVVIKLDVDGNVVYDRKSDYMIRQTICQLPEGGIYLLAAENGQRLRLAALDPVSGSVSVVDDLGWSRIPYAVGVAEDGLLYMDAAGFWKIDLKNKTQSEFLLFEGTSYYVDTHKDAIQAIRAADDGSLQILRSNGRVTKIDGQKVSQGHGKVETLKMVNMTGERIPIVMRGIVFGSWIKEQAALFNQSQTEYYVVLDEWPEGSDVEDFVRQTNVEIATGKGPDILCGEWMGEIGSLIQKGVFENLKPYMERSGIREEDYFPLTFSSWRDGEEIYSINSFVSLNGYRIDEAVLGSREEPDIGTLMDALLAYEENAFYLYHEDAKSLLRMFLEGSEDLWGMVDWENGTCDFNGELFAKILQVSKRYGYDERFHYSAVAELRNYSIIGFDSRAEQEKEKKVPSGILFDDGCHAGTDMVYYTMALNANSAHKEGGWAFLRFLLGEEAQVSCRDQLPVLKQAFDEIAAELLTHVNDKNAEENSVTTNVRVNGEVIMGVTRTLKDLTEEKVAELRAVIEDARTYPIHTEPLLDIIQEEAGYYFEGIKDMDEVKSIIENRVRLYLEENG